MTEWQQISTIEMLVNSAELCFSIKDSNTQLKLNCNLLNIARGNCSIFLLRENNSKNSITYNELIIKEDKAIMEARKSLDYEAFDNIRDNIKNILLNKNKKIKISFKIDKLLAVDSSGVLMIDKEMKLEIISINFSIPIL